MSTGTTIFIIALVLILAFGATMVLRTFRDTDRRRGSVGDEEAIEREVQDGRPRHGRVSDEDVVERDVYDDRSRRDFDSGGHGRHEFR